MKVSSLRNEGIYHMLWHYTTYMLNVISAGTWKIHRIHQISIWFSCQSNALLIDIATTWQYTSTSTCNIGNSTTIFNNNTDTATIVMLDVRL